MTEKHIHRWKRLRYKSGNEVYFCVLPDCNKKVNPPLLLGKRAICWRCSQEFILTEYSLRLAKPHCASCHKPKKMDEVPLSEIVPEPRGIGLSLAERLRQITTQEEDEI